MSAELRIGITEEVIHRYEGGPDQPAPEQPVQQPVQQPAPPPVQAQQPVQQQPVKPAAQPVKHIVGVDEAERLGWSGKQYAEYQKSGRHLEEVAEEPKPEPAPMQDVRREQVSEPEQAERIQHPPEPEQVERREQEREPPAKSPPRMTKEEWKAIGEQFPGLREEAVKKGEWLPPEGMKVQDDVAQAPVEDRHKANVDYRREKTDARTEKERQEYGTAENALNADRQRKDEDFAARQESRDEKRAAREEERARKQEQREDLLAYRQAERAEKQQQRDEDFAVKQERRDEKRAEMDARENAPFDPYEAAEKSRDVKVRKEQVAAAYEEIYGTVQQTKSTGDAILDAAQAMRGTLGGTFGAMVGAGLDVLSAVRAAQPKQKSPERVEAEQRNAAMKQPEYVAQEVERVEQPPEEMPVAKHAPPKDAVEWWPENAPRKDSATGKAVQQPKASSPQSATNASSTATRSGPPPAQPPAVKPPVAAGAGQSAAGAGAAAAGGAGGAASMAAAAGPVAIAAAAIMATKVVADAAGGLVSSVGDAAASLGTFKDGSARLHEMSAAMGSVTTAALVLTPALGPIPVVLSAVVGATVGSIAKLDDAVKNTADRLGQYNGDLAVQNAMQDFSEIMRDMRRAEKFGAATMGANEGRFNMEQRLADITDRFMPAILAVSERVFKVTAGLLVLGEKAFDIATLAMPSQQITAQGVSAIGASVLQIIAALEALGQSAQAAEMDRAWDDFLTNGGTGLNSAPPTMPPPPGPAIG